ncbi:uncharacterized protein PAE49_000937 [Odontesthes bonariensis]|uniref:uncharacterized protein LOC142373934 n=1 Tax=Odontesthes bonariensis TaxID=219752 RepID=UPI003F583852
MQCANLLKRRGLEAEAEPWSRRPKRMCLEAELQGSESPMETSHSATNRQPEQQVGAAQLRPSSLCCPRCLGGEPGHISHIMGH